MQIISDILYLGVDRGSNVGFVDLIKY